jgi:long-chain-fatty-acid---luciferin-component ligase
MLKTSNFVGTLKGLGIDPLAAAAASVTELYRMSDEELNQVKTELIADAFRFHYENNPYYRKACEEKGVTPGAITRYEDLIRIPLIPIAKFKSVSNHELLSRPLNTIEHEMRSTGTSGIPSVSRRCGDTLDTAITGIYAMYREFLGISKGAGLYICPSTEEIPEMGMIKALNMLAGLLDTHRFMVKEERFVPEDAIAQLTQWENEFTRHIIGPPFLIYRLVQFLKQTGQKIKLDKGSRVITLGGWKRFTGQMISRREFNLLCEEYLGLEPNGVRDIYALVESNVLAIDDEYQVKHVSPFVHFSVRDPNDLSREVPMGQKGVLGILDPVAIATPGMILTDRAGQRIEYIMRAPTSLEFGCCAVNLEKKMDGQAEDAACPLVN